MDWEQKLKEGRERAKGFWVAKVETRTEESTTTGEFRIRLIALNFLTFLLRNPRTKRVQKPTANASLYNKVSRRNVNNDSGGFEVN